MTIFEDPFDNYKLHKDGSKKGYLLVEGEDEHFYYGRYFLWYKHPRGRFSETALTCIDMEPKRWIKKMHTWERAIIH